MLYKMRASVDGREVSRFVRAENIEAAIRKFIEDWTEHGDPEPVGVYVDESWKEST